MQASFHGIKIPELNVASGGSGDKLLDDKLDEKAKAAIARSFAEAQERIKERSNNGGQRTSN